MRATVEGVRALMVLLPLVAACRPAPHIDLSIKQQCTQVTGEPSPPMTCSAMQLGCANFVEVRLYQSDDQGTLGSILQSNCMSTTALGNPTNLCALTGGHVPIALLDHLPDGKTVRFRLRALKADMTTQCNDDVPGDKTPLLLFDGFSPPVPIDGNDHAAQITIGFCDSCFNVTAPIVVCPAGHCGPQCTPGTLPPGAGGDCCLATQSNCMKPGSVCPNGERALVGPGGCCAVCP
jgi:hypothetical protein